MKEPQEFHPIDDFYRKTLENPAQSTSNPGWDVPSSKVWENVQTGIRPVGGFWLKMLGAAATVGLVAAALYFFNRPEPATTLPENAPSPAVNQSSEQPVAPVTQPTNATEIGSEPGKPSEMKATKPATKPTVKPVPKPVEPRVNHTTPSSESPAPATYNNPGTPKSAAPAETSPAPVLPIKTAPNAQDTPKKPVKNTPPPRNHAEETKPNGGQD